MKRIELNHLELKDRVRFTDPFLHSYEKQEDILHYFRAGTLRPPSLIERDQRYLIFNGNHRVLVAINNKLTISCNIVESLEDIIRAQTDEGDRFRDISMVSPLTLEGVVDELLECAEQWSHQNPDDYSFADF